MSETTTATASPAHERYSGLQIALHWATAIIIIGMIPTGMVMTSLDPSPFKNLLYELHKSFGLIIVGLTAIRLVTRWLSGAPPLVPMSPVKRAAAKATHIMLYALLVLAPLSGWAATSACCAPVNLFWSIPLTLPVSGGFDVAKRIFAVHYGLTLALAGLLLLHAAAALHHHYALRDLTLRRMLPGSGGTR
ncbi:MAG: cytochrome b [Salinarimonadaceae bacterium]|nr:MAG: cytochrome b [Salinarimonadaceae bacterium]